MATKNKQPQISIRTIFGLAKSAELHLSTEELHDIVYAQVEKEHISELNQREILTIVCYLTGLKDSVRRAEGCKAHPNARGNPATINQRKKIFKQTEALGINGKVRVRELCKKMFKVTTIEWLSYVQCSDLIEALKAILEREEKQTEGKEETPCQNNKEVINA